VRRELFREGKTRERILWAFGDVGDGRGEERCGDGGRVDCGVEKNAFVFVLGVDGSVGKSENVEDNDEQALREPLVGEDIPAVGVQVGIGSTIILF
jgi:hypothetical protein